MLKVNTQTSRKNGAFIMKIVALHNLGCKVNAYEMEQMERNLTENGFRVVPFDQKADIYIINTCSVTNIADRKSRQMLHKAKSMNPSAIIVAAGCYVNTRGAEEVLDSDADIAVINEDKKNIASILNQYLSVHRPDALSSCELISASERSDDSNTRTRAYLKVQDGCNQFCSYCIIPYARGRIRSRKIADIHEEAASLSEKGYHEFVLTGIHLSSFGIDRPDDRETLMDLISDIASVDGVYRIRLGSLEPRIITESFVQALSEISQICPQFHLSLQSGSDTVLKRMNRHYSAAEYLNSVNILRKYFSDPAITTDVIVGFPGETAEEFDETVEFLKKVNFYETHVFKYSRRAGTVADKMPGQLTDAEKSARSDILLQMTAERKAAFSNHYISTVPVEVLFEDLETINGTEYITGYTREYIRAALPSGSAEPGDIMTGYITGYISSDIMAFSLQV